MNHTARQITFTLRPWLKNPGADLSDIEHTIATILERNGGTDEPGFNPDRLITTPRTLGEVHENERRGAIVTECCNMAIGPDCRFCPKCGYEARITEV